MAEVDAVEVSDRQCGASGWREAPHLLAREFAHRRVTAKPTAFL
jgi:hypothetical protein